MPVVPNHQAGGHPTRKVREVLSTQSFVLNRPNAQTGDSPTSVPTQPNKPAVVTANTQPQHQHPHQQPSQMQATATSSPPRKPSPVQLQDDGPAYSQHAHAHDQPYTIPQSHSVSNPVAKPISETNPDVDSVDLPSLGQFYGHTSVSVSPVKGRTVAKFHRAYLEQKLRFTVEAISSTLEGVSAFTLTPGDFYYLMYWHKARNIKNNSSLVTGFCQDPNHVKQVNAGTKAPDTLKIEQLLTRSTLEVKNLPVIDTQKWRDLLPDYQLGVETMQDVVDSSEAVQAMIDEATTENGVDLLKDRSTEFIWLAERAGYVIPQGDDKSFSAKLKLIEEMDPSDISILDEYIKEVTNYGVSEFANLRCKDCSALTRVKLSFDALCFLPGS